MKLSRTVVFICEHGAAKSILAAAYFNQLARESGVNLRAIARGTKPDPELSPQLIAGLANDGLAPGELRPQKLTKSVMRSAQWVISFCALPRGFQKSSVMEYWMDVPPVSQNYQLARDVILDRVRNLLASIE